MTSANRQQLAAFGSLKINPIYMGKVQCAVDGRLMFLITVYFLSGPFHWLMVVSIGIFYTSCQCVTSKDIKTSKHDSNWEPSPKHLTFFRRLIEIIGNKPINAIDREDAKHVVRKIKELPSKSAQYKNRTVDEVIDLNINEKTLSAKTINDHLELYSRLFIWIASEIDKQQSNPFDRLRIKTDKKQKTNQARNSFTREEITTIFSTPLYARGKYKAPHQFWAPLIALHAGARRAEIASLYIGDIYQDNNAVWVFDFNELKFRSSKNTATY